MTRRPYHDRSEDCSAGWQAGRRRGPGAGLCGLERPARAGGGGGAHLSPARAQADALHRLLCLLAGNAGAVPLSRRGPRDRASGHAVRHSHPPHPGVFWRLRAAAQADGGPLPAHAAPLLRRLSRRGPPPPALCPLPEMGGHRRAARPRCRRSRPLQAAGGQKRHQLPRPQLRCGGGAEHGRPRPAAGGVALGAG